MADIVDLDAHRPHYAGLCSCLTCHHEWTAVAPTMATVLECPSCRTMRGVMFSAREVRLARALEQIATGYAPGENSRIDAADPRAAIAFPYWPDRADVPSPVVEFAVPTQSAT